MQETTEVILEILSKMVKTKLSDKHNDMIDGDLIVQNSLIHLINPRKIVQKLMREGVEHTETKPSDIVLHLELKLLDVIIMAINRRILPSVRDALVDQGFS